MAPLRPWGDGKVSGKNLVGEIGEKLLLASGPSHGFEHKHSAKGSNFECEVSCVGAVTDRESIRQPLTKEHGDNGYHRNLFQGITREMRIFNNTTISIKVRILITELSDLARGNM